MDPRLYNCNIETIVYNNMNMMKCNVTDTFLGWDGARESHTKSFLCLFLFPHDVTFN